MKSKKYISKEVKIGNLLIGNNNPIKIQSMTNTDTLDIEKTTSQIMNLSDHGCDIVRLTVQGISQAYACENIKNILLKKGYDIPLVADIHFFPKAAIIVSDFVEKVRINPGNYAEKRANYKKNNFTKEEYLQSLKITEEKFLPLIDKLKKNKVALRIGVNHGSLSDRIMSKYGNTKEGMVESAIEYAKICVKHNFHSIVFSMKSSNVKVMIEAYRLLVFELIKENLNYPLHLGVTEAGEGLDGEVRSAIGIGSLLLDGIGDTIRVSLTNDPIEEINPAYEISKIKEKYKDYKSINISKDNKNSILAVDINDNNANKNIDFKVDPKDSSFLFLEDIEVIEKKYKNHEYIIYTPIFPIHKNIRELFQKLEDKKINTKILLNTNNLKYSLENIAILGSLLIDGIIDGIFTNGDDLDIVLNIMQASRKRNSKTEFISCPSCGRTLFDIQKVVLKLKKEFSNIPNLKIAVMGCIVNGIGEMQDAEFGYVGAGKDLVDLYVNQKVIKKNILSKDAFFELKNLIEKKYGTKAL
ncbi:MAG: 4-hydroxy-3-methylbut-2-en-1-yl diphosphate synthase (ferredoxin) [Candidatus Anoxychlamydiales bacterium]|nr:4-hydroxy-3-methylbut-2-en-1-yl diphosphate synthase (ferredoxin) [Candidatus Anoxychlamydiales bacterium]